MIRLVLRLIIDGYALWTAMQLVPGMHSPDGCIRLLLTLALFGMLTVLIRPIIILMAFPLLLIIFAPLMLFLNASIIYLCALIAGLLGLGFTVEGMLPAAGGAVIVTVVRTLITEFVRMLREKQVFRSEQIWRRRLKHWKMYLSGQMYLRSEED
jgi:putative membrane protein